MSAWEIETALEKKEVVDCEFFTPQKEKKSGTIMSALPKYHFLICEHETGLAFVVNYQCITNLC